MFPHLILGLLAAIAQHLQSACRTRVMQHTQHHTLNPCATVHARLIMPLAAAGDRVAAMQWRALVRYDSSGLVKAQRACT